MSARMPHNKITFGRTEIERTTVSVVYMEVLKNMKGDFLYVIALKQHVDIHDGVVCTTHG